MTRAEQVRHNRLCASRSVELYYKMCNTDDARIVQLFDAILDIMDQNTKQLILTDILLFEPRTRDVKEYSIHEDGLYHFQECILHFEKKVNVESYMNELKEYIERQDGFYAKKLPYQWYYNEKLTHYLQIGIKT